MEIYTHKNKDFEAHKIELHGKNLLVINGKIGFLACGYLNIDVAEKFNQPAAIVTGVKTFDDMSVAKIVALTSASENLGLKLGMTGSDALELF